MGAVVIQTAKVRKMVEQPYLRVEAPERSNGWGSRTEYTHESRRPRWRRSAEIKRHVDDLGHVSMVAPECWSASGARTRPTTASRRVGAGVAVLRRSR
jgi:hypothetical protein